MITPRVVRAGSVVLRAALLSVAALGHAACSSAGTSTSTGADSAGGSYAGPSDPSAPRVAGRSVQEGNSSCPAAPAGVSIGLDVGNQLEELVVQSCDGQTVSLAKLCGNKATWLYLVHGWCPHVKNVSSFAEEMHESYASRGLHSVHVMVENAEHRAPTAEDCKAWKERWGLKDVELYFDQTGNAKGLMNSEYTSVSSFLDKNLVITDKVHLDDEPGLRARLETLLAR